MSRVFFLSTLPLLTPDTEPPFDENSFLELARRYLGGSEYGVLEELALNKPSRHPFVLGWRHHEIQLRNAVARLRAVRLGLDASPWLRPHEEYDVMLEQSVAAAFQESNPLRREEALDKIRWRYAGELASFDPLAFTAVLTYFLHLRLIIKKSVRDPEQGFRRLDEISQPDTNRMAETENLSGAVSSRGNA